jgi:cobalt-zinc-cadmium efflux system membrane fusion protein
MMRALSARLVTSMLAALLAAAPVASATDDDRHDAPGAHDADHDDSDHEGHGDDHDDHGGDTFSPAALARFGVTLATAGPGTVDLGVSLPAEIRPDANRVAHLAPRFPGIVQAVRAQVGDRVQAGDVLAVIESENLAPYALKSGIDGVVLDRHVTVGEAVDRDHTAFVVADLARVWVHVSVYQEDVNRVRVGQRVRIDAGHGEPEAESTIAYVAPVVDEATRTASARAELPNPDGRWRPGLFVTAHVQEPVEAAVVVPRTALQLMGDRPVVFVVEGERFAARPIVLGREGRTLVEVTAGLAADERFAATETFLVKAELGKGEAEHAH